MANLTSSFLGIKSPNPFWLASAPPTDKQYNVERAFKAGWGGVVWKTLGAEGPPIVNVQGPRYGAIHSNDRRLLGLNNIELITDRPLEINLKEIKEVKKKWPDRAMVVSLMVPCEEQCWIDILKRVEETEADGIELNFGCPHGMSERGMGSAVGQVPDYVEMVARWCKQNTRMPVIVKLTPNISDIRQPARAALKGGADAVSLINAISSGEISGKIAKKVFEIMVETGDEPTKIIKEKGLKQQSDPKELEKIIIKVLEANSDKVLQYNSGKEKLYGFFVGEIMKASSGSANPKLVNDILKVKLKK